MKSSVDAVNDLGKPQGKERDDVGSEGALDVVKPGCWRGILKLAVALLFPIFLEVRCTGFDHTGYILNLSHQDF